MVPYEYAVIQAVPRIDRGELINVGVLLYCQRHDFLAARTHLDEDRLRALDPAADVPAIRAALDSWSATCTGGGAGCFFCSTISRVRRSGSSGCAATSGGGSWIHVTSAANRHSVIGCAV